MATLEEIARILGGLSAFYPRFEINKPLIHAYFKVLQDVPRNILEVAALQIGADSKWFPTASELRKASFDLSDRAIGIPSGANAWAEISKQVNERGSWWPEPEWSHPIIGYAVNALGGYLALCQTENVMVDRAHFFKIYETLLMRERETKRMLPEVQKVIKQLAEGMRIPQIESKEDF